MKINDIASALCSDSGERADKMILTDAIWCDEFSDMVADSWSEVRSLKRQRDGLTEVFPAKKAEHQKQFDAEVIGVAQKLYSRIWETTP